MRLPLHVLLIAILAPDVSPAVSSFVAKGGLAGVVPLILIDVALGAIFSEQRAMRALQRRGGRAELPAAHIAGDRTE